jgi:hypothetical protein
MWTAELRWTTFGEDAKTAQTADRSQLTKWAVGKSGGWERRWVGEDGIDSVSASSSSDP